MIQEGSKRGAATPFAVPPPCVSPGEVAAHAVPKKATTFLQRDQKSPVTKADPTLLEPIVGETKPAGQMTLSSCSLMSPNRVLGTTPAP